MRVEEGAPGHGLTAFGRRVDAVVDEDALDGGAAGCRGRAVVRTDNLGEYNVPVAIRYTVWLRIGFRWVRLLGTRPFPTEEKNHVLEGLSGFAVAVARTLDVPIRYIH